METTSTQLEQMSALLYLSSPALPIGAFAYSQGLESAIETGHVTNKQSLFKWVETVIAEGLLKLDIPLFNRAYRHVIESDYRALNACNAEVFAARESFELYEEERLLGSALMRLLRTQHLLPEDLDQGLDKQRPISLIVGFAIASVQLQLGVEAARLGFLWSWLENQMAVAAKAIPLGQSDVQRVVLAMRPRLIALLSDAAATRCTISSGLPGQALLSAGHETQYSRLFRS